MENTIIELVDRLVAESNRRAIAEHELATANETIKALRTKVADLEKEVDFQTSMTVWSAKRNGELSDQLAALKGGEPDACEV